MTGKTPRRWPGPLVVSAARGRGELPDVQSPRGASANAAPVDAAPLQPATIDAAGAGEVPPAAVPDAEALPRSTLSRSTLSRSTLSRTAPPLDGPPLDGPPLDSAGFGTPAPATTPVLEPDGSAWHGPAFEPRRAQRAVASGSPERTVGERALAEPGSSRCAYGVALATTPPALAVAPVRRALVVDDDPEVRRALARFLRPELDVCLAGSVSDAKAVVAGLDRLDVAFVDWELPDGTGEQILEWLSRWPDAIRVLISARFASSASPTTMSSGDASLASSKPSSECPQEWSGWGSGERPGERASDPPLRHNPLKNRALANLVLGKPVATSVIEALKRAALALPHD